MIPARRRVMVDWRHRHLSVVRQCEFIGVGSPSLHYRAKETSQRDLSLMPEVDRQYLETLFQGSGRVRASLERQGMPVSRKRVQRLMRRGCGPSTGSAAPANRRRNAKCTPAC